MLIDFKSIVPNGSRVSSSWGIRKDIRTYAKRIETDGFLSS